MATRQTWCLTSKISHCLTFCCLGPGNFGEICVTQLVFLLFLNIYLYLLIICGWELCTPMYRCSLRPEVWNLLEAGILGGCELEFDCELRVAVVNCVFWALGRKFRSSSSTVFLAPQWLFLLPGWNFVSPCFSEALALVSQRILWVPETLGPLL